MPRLWKSFSGGIHCHEECHSALATGTHFWLLSQLTTCFFAAGAFSCSKTFCECLKLTPKDTGFSPLTIPVLALSVRAESFPRVLYQSHFISKPVPSAGAVSRKQTLSAVVSREKPDQGARAEPTAEPRAPGVLAGAAGFSPIPSPPASPS